jgi:hypothetical protein
MPASDLPTFTMSACYFPERHLPMLVQFAARMDSVEEAQRVAGLFPKAAKARGVRSTAPKDGSYLNGSVTTGAVTIQVDLTTNRSTGAVNESALKRLATIRRALAALGATVEWGTGGYGNAYETVEALDAALATYAAR